MRLVEMSEMKKGKGIRTVESPKGSREDLKDFAKRYDLAELYRKYTWEGGAGKDTWENSFPCILELERNMVKKAKRNLVKEEDVRQVINWGNKGRRKVRWCEVDLPLYDKSGKFKKEVRQDPSIAPKQLVGQKCKGLIKHLSVTYLSKVLRFAAPSEFGVIDTRIVRVFGQGDDDSKQQDWLSLTVKGKPRWAIYPESKWPEKYGYWIKMLRFLANLLNSENNYCPHPKPFIKSGLRQKGVWVCADVEMALWSYATQYTNPGKPYCPQK